MIGIYKITNLINNKIYIGQSINIENRWKQHIYKAWNEKELGYNQAIHSAFHKYGIDNFLFEILEETTVEELDERECFWIQELNTLAPNGYNILQGGQVNRNIYNNDKFCQQCGKPLSTIGKTHLCQSCYNSFRSEHIPNSDELLQCLQDNNGNFTKVGRIYNVTDNAVRKWCKKYNLPTSSKEYKLQQIHKPYKRKVMQLDYDTNSILNIYESVNAAARALGHSKGSHITEVCNGKLNSSYGYKWRYVDE